MTNQVTSTAKLAPIYKMRADNILRILKAGKVAPAFTAPMGRGSMTFYDMTEARTCLDAYVLKMQKKDKAPPPAPVITLTGVEKTLAGIADELEEVKKLCTQIVSANAILLKAIQASNAHCQAIAKDLGVKETVA